jgi:hypothetical protein
MAALVQRALPLHSSSSKKRKVAEDDIQIKEMEIFVLKHDGRPICLAFPDFYAFKDQLKLLPNANVNQFKLGDETFRKALNICVFYKNGIYLPELGSKLNNSWYVSETPVGFESAQQDSFMGMFIPLAYKIANGLNTIPYETHSKCLVLSILFKLLFIVIYLEKKFSVTIKEQEVSDEAIVKIIADANASHSNLNRNFAATGGTPVAAAAVAAVDPALWKDL